MSSLNREIVFLLLQFLDEEKFKETVHKLEQESGFYFNMKHFEDQVLAGEWDEVERYLSGFTKFDENQYSMKVFFEIRKQKYLEALDSNDRTKALDILVKDLKPFAAVSEEAFKEITQLLTLENFRQNEQLSMYGDAKSARNILLNELKKLIEANPSFRDKLTFPTFKASRLRNIINQSLNWQHQHCKNPHPNPDIKTILADHSCPPTNVSLPVPPINVPLVGPLSKSCPFHRLVAHSPFRPIVPRPASAIAGWMSNANQTLPRAAVAQGPPGLLRPPNMRSAASLKYQRAPSSATIMEYQTVNTEHLSKNARSGQSDEGNMHLLDNLPRTVVRTLNLGSSVMSFDFHPQHQSFILVGTNIGEISIWEVGSRERIAHKAFKLWDVSACSMPFQEALMKDATISVNRCLWSPDGSIIGIAFSKHVVQTYAYSTNGELRNHLEIDAHVGGVNDISFALPNKSLSIVTCGDDRMIKVWDAMTGQRQYVLEGHGAPVYSVCPHSKGAIQFLFSTAIDGKIKAWLYDCKGSRVDYIAPGNWCTTMAYSSDGSRLFSCGTSIAGESHLVEWNESEGSIKMAYSGFKKRSLGVVQFDTTRNRFLAAGAEYTIKFWDMDKANILTTTDAEGGLLASPRLRFNKEGSLLAVTIENGIKILANVDGQHLLRMLETRAFEGSRVASQQIGTKPPIPLERGDRSLTSISVSSLSIADGRTADVKPKVVDADNSRSWKLDEIVNPAHLKAITLPDSAKSKNKILCLIYTNSGLDVLALASNAVHKLWKWQCGEQNPSGESTASVVPQLSQPPNGLPMTNETKDINPEESSACFALSKNDSYVVSASGGKVTLFNIKSFKVITTFTDPPPAATSLAFHPLDNNIIAVGMEDSSIQIYNVLIDKVKIKLQGHQKKITGLAFSQSLNALVSSAADAQICMWSIDGWDKKKARYIQTPAGHESPLAGDTRVQFHNDQHLLVVHETQLSIYDSQLECLRSWSPRDPLPAPISSAVYSCDGLSIYAGFFDGAVGVFDSASLRLHRRIAPSSYATSSIASAGLVYPIVVAAHPLEVNQMALGMSDGTVYVVEPSDVESKSGGPTSQENGALPAMSSNPSLSNQVSDAPSR
ncbi:protein TPR2-like isoform X2 [Phalaenopsis equestris]|uniref:protein TPR2-like isoform X2 n=1 Tax=Phalaenopsis equestris TaxID=78828 RepID=UPI0009E1A18B|nr:protein TPR2-like isoform X2 [Phalaenopsis equestris]